MVTDIEPSNLRLQIDDLTLDKGTRQVWRGKQKLDLPKLSYRMLLALAEAAPNVITFDELAKEVWPGSVVSPETITQRIKLVRQSIDDDANSPRYIGVVRGEGYRLLTEVEALPPEDANLTRGLVAELGRRRVLQVALVYAAVAWSITEVVSFLIEALPVFPAGSKALVAIVFVVGFPVAMFLAWRFDIGPKGIRRTQAATAEGRATIAAAVLLLTGATAGLFYLIYPRVVEQARLDAPTAVEPQENTIAVLPFENASNDPEDLYISEGIGDELRDQLGRIGGLQVAARSSSRIFAAPEFDALAISQRLGVAKLVEGSLRREGDQLRVTVQIIDGATGFQLWSNSFSRISGDLLATQQAIAQEVTSQLLPELGQAIPQAAMATAVESAHDLMLVARHYFQQVQDDPVVDLELLMKSIDLYRQATIADPNSALAHSRLGAALLYLGNDEQAEGPIFRALSINPDLSEVQYTLGLYYYSRYQSGASVAYERAIELNSNNVDALSAYGLLIWAQESDTYSATSALQRALTLDPMSILRYMNLGNVLGMAGRRDEALELADQIKARFDDPRAYLTLARIYELTGDLDVAIGWALQALKVDPEDRDAKWQLAELYARIGDFEGAHYFEDPETSFNLLYWERRYEEMIELGEELVFDTPHQTQVWYGLARAYAATGRVEQTLNALKGRGLPDHALVEVRRPSDLEALINYTDSLNVAGQQDRAQELAHWIIDHYLKSRANGMERSWFADLAISCSLSILGRDEEALAELERVLRSNGMPWYPVIRDQPCFKRFAGSARYDAVIDQLEQRKTELRDRLPDTLAQMQTAW